MKVTDTISHELRSLSPLLSGFSREQIFFVPPFYFDNLSKAILLCIEQEQAGASLQAIEQVSPPPAGYFDNLSAVILNKIKDEHQQSAAQELTTISPLLQQLQSINVHQVPAGYFEGSTAAILRARPARVVSMFGGNTIIRYAAAAVFIGALSLGVYQYLHQPSRITEAIRFAQLDPAIQKGSRMNEQQFSKALTQLSQADISDYLEKNSGEEILSNSNDNLNEITLPQKDDYLLNEKTLDNYLKSINN